MEENYSESSSCLIDVVDDKIQYNINRLMNTKPIVMREVAIVKNYKIDNHTAQVSFPNSDITIVTNYAYPNKTGHILSVGDKVYVVYHKNNLSQGWIEDTVPLIAPSWEGHVMLAPNEGIFPSANGFSSLGINGRRFGSIYGINYYGGSMSATSMTATNISATTFLQNGISIPNVNEVPIITYNNGWSAYKFPSGLLIQCRWYQPTVVVNSTEGGGFFGVAPIPTGYPISFSETGNLIREISAQVTLGLYFSFQDISFSSNFGQIRFHSPVSWSSGLTPVLYLTAIGRWK